jgi:hypothetical protein
LIYDSEYDASCRKMHACGRKELRLVNYAFTTIFIPSPAPFIGPPTIERDTRSRH